MIFQPLLQADLFTREIFSINAGDAVEEKASFIKRYADLLAISDLKSLPFPQKLLFQYVFSYAKRK